MSGHPNKDTITAPRGMAVDTVAGFAPSKPACTNNCPGCSCGTPKDLSGGAQS